jgi:hypothetical protein
LFLNDYRIGDRRKSGTPPNTNQSCQPATP